MFHKVLEKLEKKMYVKDPTLSSDEYKKVKKKLAFIFALIR